LELKRRLGYGRGGFLLWLIAELGFGGEPVFLILFEGTPLGAPEGFGDFGDLIVGELMRGRRFDAWVVVFAERFGEGGLRRAGGIFGQDDSHVRAFRREFLYGWVPTLWDEEQVQCQRNAEEFKILRT